MTCRIFCLALCEPKNLACRCLGWKTDIFLQVNGNEPSVHFYQSDGFLKCGSNSMLELPRSIRARQSSGNGFVHFVDTKHNLSKRQ